MLEIWFPFQMLCAMFQIGGNCTSRGFGEVDFLKVINIFYCFETVALWNKWRGSFFLKNGSLHPMMLDAKFGWSSLISFREYIRCFQKRSMYFNYFVIISPCTGLNRLEFSLFMNTSWHLSWNCPCLVRCYYLPLQNGMVSRYQRLFLSLHLSCLCNLKRTCNSGNQAPPPPPPPFFFIFFFLIIFFFIFFYGCE